jgi:UDP-N-acetyl-D-mannosaminuronate dehydrogenase
MPQYTVSLIEKVLQENNVPRKSKIAVLGVAYKGNIGDTRESPAIFIVKELLKKGYEVFTYDPYTRESFGAISTNSMEEAIMGAYVTIIVTDHEQFKEIDLGKLKDKMAKPIIIDCRHLIDLRKAKKLGFIYYGIGCKRCNKNDNTRSSGNKAGNN